MPDTDQRHLSAQEEADLLTAEARSRATGQAHFPNQISRPLRRRHLIQAVAVALYASLGLSLGKVVLPAKARVIEFTGGSAMLLGAAMLVAALNMLSVVIDHHDKRDNEGHYALFANVTRWLSWILALTATVLHVIKL